MKTKTLIIALDGVSSKDFFNFYNSGKIPNIKSFFDDGLIIENLVSTYPSDSATCYPLITHNLKLSEREEIGQMWYKRKNQQFMYLWDFLPMFHSRVKKVKIPSVFKGYKKTLIIGMLEAKDAGFYIPPFQVIFGLNISKLGITYDTIVLKSIPQLFNYFDTIIFSSFSADHLFHSYGFEGLETSIKNMDEKIGYVTNKLKDRLNIFIFADHGNTPLKGKFSLSDVLRENGYNLTRYLRVKKDVAIVTNLLNYAFIYTKDDPENILNIFRKYPQIGVAASKDKKNNFIIVSNSKGRAKIFKDKERFCYITKEGDPLEYKECFKEENFNNIESKKNKSFNIRLTKEEWLKKSLNCRFPYAVIRICEAFENKNCGDIAVSFDNGYCPNFSFILGGRLKFTSRWPTFYYNHGGLERDQILSFLIANGKDIKSERKKFALLEDLYLIFKNYFDSIK